MNIFANTSWQSSAAGLVSWKTPTTLLLGPEEEFVAFGYDAEEEYNDLIENDEHRQYHYFRRFKMMLYNKQVYAQNHNKIYEPRHAKRALSVAMTYLRNDVIFSR